MGRINFFSTSRLYALLFCMFYINQLTILSEATLLGDLSLNVVHTAEAEPHELLLTRNSLKKSKSLPNLNLDKFPLEIKSEPLSDVSVPELAECPKTENEGTKIDSFRSEEQENVHEGGIVENNKAKLKKVAFEQLQDAEPSRSSHSSQSHQPVNLQTSYESHLHSPPIPNSYHPGSAFANSQEAQVFPGFTYPLGSEEFTSPSPYLVYAHPGVLYSLVKGKPKEIVPSATTTNNIPIIHSAVQQFEHLAPSYVSPKVFYGPQSQPYHSESPLMQTIGGHPAAYPSGYSTQGYGYQNSQNILSQPPIFNYNSGSSSVQNPSQYVPTPFQSTGLHGHYSGYDPSHYMTAPLQQQEFQYHPIDLNSYKAVNLHPPRYQGISSSAAHPHRHVSKKWRTRSPPVWDVYPVKSVERNTDMKNDPAQFNSEKESGYTDASSSSHSSLNGSSNSDMNRKYTNVFNNFRSKDEEKAILKKEDQKNQLENNEKDFSVVNNSAPEDNLNYNSNNIMGGNHAKMVLDKEKNLERVAVNKPDLENFSKSSSNVEISSSSSIESEFDSQKEADKAADHQKPEVKQSSQGGFYLPRYSRKKKPIKNSFYGYESSRQNGWKSHYKITKNLGFKTKYIPKNKHLDKKDELMLNDIHYENQNNGSKDDKISKLTTDYDSEKTLKLKEILGLENRQVSKESKDLLEDENTFINNSEGKRRKNTFITSLEDLKGNSEKADFLKNRISLKDDIKKTNIDSTDDSSHLQAHHNAGETSTNKMKQSDPQGTLEKNREPSTESKELFNKKSKEDEKIQIESTSTSDDKILPMMADSQLDPTKNQKTEHDMNQEKNFNRQDQKLAEEGEKKIEVSLSQKPELIISSNEDFPLLAEAIKTNKKNMLIEGEKKLKANKIYGAESSRNSALRNNYKNIKNSGVNAKDLSNEKVLDNKKELILNHNHSKNKIKYIQGDYVLEPPMDYNSKKRFKLEEILGAENPQVPKKSEKKIEAEKNVINKSEGIQKDILSFPVEVQVENSEEASLVQNKLFVKNNKKNSIDPRKDFSLFQDKQNKREKNAEKSAIQEILQKGNKPIPNVGNILNLNEEKLEKISQRVEKDQEHNIGEISTNKKSLDTVTDSPSIFLKNEQKNQKLIKSKFSNQEDQMVEDNMGKKTVAMISGKVDLEKEKPKALLSNKEKNIEEQIPNILENKTHTADKKIDPLVIPKLDLESNSIGSSRTSIGNGRKNKNSKIFMPSEHNGLKLSTFKNSKSNNKKDFKKNEVNDLGNFSEHIEVEKIGSNEKKITQKGKQIKGVENLKNHGADTNSLEEDLNVLRSRLESNNFSENQTETPKSKNNVNLLEAKKSNGSSLEKNVSDNKNQAKREEKNYKAADELDELSPISRNKSIEKLDKLKSSSSSSSSSSLEGYLSKVIQEKPIVEQNLKYLVKSKPNNSKSKGKEVNDDKDIRTQSISSTSSLNNSGRAGEVETPKNINDLSTSEKDLGEDSSLSSNFKHQGFSSQKTDSIQKKNQNVLNSKENEDLRNDSDENLGLSLDYLLKENLREIIKINQYEKLGIKGGMIKDWLIDSEVFKSNAKETWNSWRENKLDPHTMYHMGIILNFNHLDLLHAPINLSLGYTIERMLDSFLKNPSKYKEAEDWYIKKMPPFEGKRRILSLRKQIQNFVIKEKWFALVRIQNHDSTGSIEEIVSLDQKFSITSGASDILFNDRFFRKGQELYPIPDIVKKTFGSEEAVKRVEFLDYVKNRSNPIKWWRSKPYYNQLDFEYGVDYFTALKVSDILQFGWYSIMDSNRWGRMTVDNAFFSLMDVMKSSEKCLPWNESPERNWLMGYDNEKYMTKLISFGILVTRNQNLIKEQLLKNPARVKDFEYLFGGTIHDIDQIILGELIIWWDLGYIPQNFLKMKNILQKIASGLMSKNKSHKTKSIHSWIKLANRRENRRMVIDFCVFFHQNFDKKAVLKFRDLIDDIFSGKEKKVKFLEDEKIQLEKQFDLIDKYAKSRPAKFQVINKLYDLTYLGLGKLFG